MAVLGDPHLADVMERYRFSIVEMRTLGSGSAPWARGFDGRMAFDNGGRWRQVALYVRRDLMCEQCGETFGYSFRVVAEGGTHQGRRAQAYEALTRAVQRQLRRRLRCPHCRAVQRERRRHFVRYDRRHSLIGSAAIGGGVLGSIGCVMGGYALAGGWGLALGAAAAVGLVIKLTEWMLVHLLEGDG